MMISAMTHHLQKMKKPLAIFSYPKLANKTLNEKHCFIV